MIGHYTEESETRGSLFCIPNDDSAVLFPSTHRFQTLVTHSQIGLVHRNFFNSYL
jgi:hypothetical protein